MIQELPEESNVTCPKKTLDLELTLTCNDFEHKPVTHVWYIKAKARPNKKHYSN
jgi:hypothetical protein